MAMKSGPIPKRSDERTRRNKTDESGLELKKGNSFGVREAPPAREEWCDEVVHWYAMLQNSGMSEFYEYSDYAQALIIGDALNEFYSREPGRRSWQMVDTVLKHMATLGTTEGERRRMRIELEPATAPEKSAAQKAKDRWKNDLSKPASVVPLTGTTEENPA